MLLLFHIDLSEKVTYSVFCSADDEVPSVENAHSLLVMTSCFLLVALAGGLAFSVGPLVVEWLDMFDLDPGTVGWITSINIGVMFLSGMSLEFSNMYIIKCHFKRDVFRIE